MNRNELVRTRDRIDSAIEAVSSHIAAARQARLDMLADAPDLASLIAAAQDGADIVELKLSALAVLEDARRDVEAALGGQRGLRVAAASE